MKRETFPCGCIWNMDDEIFDEMCIFHKEAFERLEDYFKKKLNKLEGIKYENDS